MNLNTAAAIDSRRLRETPPPPEAPLPGFESLADCYDEPPPLKEELIAGCLRKGHKMLLSGPSKAGKSLALMALTIAIAEGIPWLGMACRQGRVLYINLELDRASCIHRFRQIYELLRPFPEEISLQNIDVWNLRGHAVPVDQLTAKLLRSTDKGAYAAVIIDPIYKIITGDENSAEQMAKFCNQFDRICAGLDTAVIYCHHHSKGAQGGKRAMDRASGSGVFARDPDAILDMIELELPEAVLRQLSRRTGAPEAALTAWRIEPTLREFPKFPSIDVYLSYPLHRVDDTGILSGLAAAETLQPWQRASLSRKASAAAKRDEEALRFVRAVEEVNGGDPPTVKELAAYLEMTERTCRDKIRQHGYRIDRNTGLVWQLPEET